MERRIAPPRDMEEILDKLVEPRSKTTPPLFETKEKALMFAAALGVHLKKVPPEVDKKGQGIRFDIFQHALDDSYINALAIFETGDLKVLASDRFEETATIFEKYSYAGLLEIKRLCFEQEGDPMEQLIWLTEETRKTNRSDVSGIDASVLKNLMGS